MRYITNSITLIASFLAIYLEEQFVSDYRAQIIGLLIIAYFLISFLRRKYKKEKDNFSSGGDIFIINTIVILLVISTGSLYSPIYFLVYFLCFGITFIFEPITVFIFAIGAAVIFMPEALTNQSLESFIKIGSIFLIAPLAFFFGKEYKDREKLAKKLQQTKDEVKNISNEIQSVIENDNNLSSNTSDKLTDALNRAKKIKK
jgi:hypothetical protein